MSILLKSAGDDLDHVLAIIETLVRVESPSTDKRAVDGAGREIAAYVRAIGGTVEMFAQRERGDHVRGRWDGTGRPVLLLGHFDTVWPIGTLERMPLRREGPRLYGPGTFDMKAGIAIGLGAIRLLGVLGLPRPPITLLLTTDEEVGSATSRALIEREAGACQAVLVLEPALPGGALKTARKGCGEFELLVHGVAAHAGVDPGKGASAVHELAEQIVRVAALQNLAHGVSVNVGTIRGGSRPNVVAEEARAVVDVRASSREDAARVEGAIRGLKPVRAGTRLTITGGFDRPPMERSVGSAALFGTAREVAASLGYDLTEGSTGGGSDGNFTAALGVATLDGLGPIGDGAHAVHEHIEIDALPWRVALLAGLLTRLASGGR